jgi:hypothetical protein
MKMKIEAQKKNPSHPDPLIRASRSPPLTENPQEIMSFDFNNQLLSNIQYARRSAFTHGHAGLDRLEIQSQRGSRAAPAAAAVPSHPTRSSQA